MGRRMVYIYIWDDKGQTTIHVIWPMVIFLFFLFLLYLFAQSSLVSTTTTHHPRMMRRWWRDDERWAIGKFFPFFFRSYYILSWMIFLGFYNYNAACPALVTDIPNTAARSSHDASSIDACSPYSSMTHHYCWRHRSHPPKHRCRREPWL